MKNNTLVQNIALGGGQTLNKDPLVIFRIH